MSRRIRVNLTRWVCRMFGHDWHDYGIKGGPLPFRHCARCGRLW